MTEPRESLAALREAWHEEDQAEAQMSVADYDGEKRTAERRLTAARAAAREAEAAAGVHLGDEGLREALDRAAQHNHEEGGHQGYAGPTLYPDCADPWCREARAALAAQENPTPHINDIDGPHPESPDWHAGYRAGRSEGPGLDATRLAWALLEIDPDDYSPPEGETQQQYYERWAARLITRLAAQENPT